MEIIRACIGIRYAISEKYGSQVCVLICVSLQMKEVSFNTYSVLLKQIRDNIITDANKINYRPEI